ncbi:hypothetical protein [Flavobacterium mesophilum]|uniref:hypothetical protein n=1 Tax=Flavobacterium mesophilum TaxID=3143495 RepID=UPI0031DCFEA5
MIKKILSLKHVHKIDKNEQKTMKGGIPECWIHALEAGCILIPAGGVCPMDTVPGICNTGRLCC